MTLAHRIATVYNHTQATPSDTWTITHNLKDYPLVDVYIDFDGGTQKIIPLEVIYVDTNSCTITFSNPQTGFASVV